MTAAACYHGVDAEDACPACDEERDTLDTSPMVSEEISEPGRHSLHETGEVSSGLPVIRPMEPGDLNYVRATWVRSRWSQVRKRQMRGRLPREVLDAWFKAERARVDAICFSGVQVLVACDPIKPESILGWMAFESWEGKCTVLHRYVRAPFRGFGIEEMLEEGTRQ